MKKKIFGIKFGTILTAVVCLVCALLIWALVKYNIDKETTDTVTALASSYMRFL